MGLAQGHLSGGSDLWHVRAIYETHQEAIYGTTSGIVYILDFGYLFIDIFILGFIY